ncbi:hypothetical protein [Parapedobacter sp. 10938]|uniref:hypothetical protein n=1 Tax=Parapedobacter flavus TaxID=3110225 RepID=UPI002DBF0A50|nr:hypothetical protein [Parapedobacter sp. 10938]MEC3881841.1 hypothetical protein [Parapedobacter sp. 10938]
MTQSEEPVIKQLFDGLTQSQISTNLKREGITPNSLSAVEKYLKALKDVNGANTMFHLGAILCLKRFIRK